MDRTEYDIRKVGCGWHSATINPPELKYAIYRNRQHELTDADALEEAPAELTQLLYEVREFVVDPTGDIPDIGICSISLAGLGNTQCSLARIHDRNYEPVLKTAIVGEWVLAMGLSMGGIPSLISHRSADRYAPALSRFIHSKLGTEFLPIESPKEEASRLAKESAERFKRKRDEDANKRSQAARLAVEAQASNREKAIRQLAEMLAITPGQSELLASAIKTINS